MQTVQFPETQYNLYLVVSKEQIYESLICKLVVATTTRQARWLAWKNCAASGPSPRAYQMPAMHTVLRITYVPGPPRIASFEPRWPDWVWILGE